MKKIIKTIMTAAILCVTALMMSICVSAETEDVELSVRLAKTTGGDWGQSVTYPKSTFDCGRITEDSIVEVEFTLEDTWSGSGCPIELIFQNYTTADPAIWAKIEPFDSDMETYAKFKYDDMEYMYGSDDFSTVDNMCVGDCGVPITVTKVTVTNCEKVEAITTATTTETTTAEVTQSTTAASSATTAATTTEAPASSSESNGGIPIVLIVVVTVVVAVIIVVVIIVLKNKRRFY